MGVIRILRKRWNRWQQLSGRERRLLLRTIPLVAAVRTGLYFLPISWMQSIAISKDGSGLSVAEIVWAVTAAARYIPKATCLAQALAARVLLIRAGHEARVEIGVAKAERFAAHAWVVSSGKVVLGGEEFERYQPILAFD